MRRWCLYLLLLLPLPALGQEVTFSHKSGIYDETFHLHLSAPAGYTIRYTLDGCRPTDSSAVYSTPLQLSEEHYSPVQVFRHQNCPDTNWVDRDEVEHIVVVRAALFDDTGACRSGVASQAYVVNSLLGRAFGLPVVSLCVDTADLFDYDSGIFVMGAHYTPSIVFGSGNYFMHGREWEKQAHFAYMSPGGETFTQDCGLRIHGGRTRSYMQKGFTLYAREEYGAKRFRHRFFPSLGQQRFKRLVLRPWMASWSGAGVEDWLCQHMVAPLQCDHLATRPVVLFLNGEYWGIYFLEEKADEHYVEEHYGYEDSTVNMLSGWGFEVENGINDDWMDLLWWVIGTDLTDDGNYRHLESKIDLGSLLDYMLFEVFTSNVDWPANNERHWSAEGSRWRWIFFDGDACLSYHRDNSVILEQLTCNDSTQEYPSSPIATVLFRRLLERPEFRALSVDRFAKLIYHHLGYNHTKPLLDSIEALVANEVRYQLARFGTPSTTAAWHGKIGNIEQYLKTRPATMFEDYAAHIGVDLSQPKAVIFPNPSAAAATLGYDTDWGGVMQATVHDLAGRRMAHISFDTQIGHNEVRLPTLPPGAYVVSIDGIPSALRWIVVK